MRRREDQNRDNKFNKSAAADPKKIGSSNPPRAAGSFNAPRGAGSSNALRGAGSSNAPRGAGSSNVPRGARPATGPRAPGPSNPPRRNAPWNAPMRKEPWNAPRLSTPLNARRGNVPSNGSRRVPPARASAPAPVPPPRKAPTARVTRLNHPRFPTPMPKVTKTVNLNGQFTLDELKNILNTVTPKPDRSRMSEHNARIPRRKEYTALERDLKRQEISSMNRLRLMRRDIWEANVLTRSLGRIDPTLDPPPNFDEKAYYQALKEEKARAMRKNPVLTDESNLQYFKSPPNRLPKSWACRPGTPLQHIYGNIVNNLPTRDYRDRHKGVLQAVANGFMYRHIKDAQKKSVYSRAAQLKDFRKHEAYIKCRRPVANIEKFNQQEKKRAAQAAAAAEAKTPQRKVSFPSMAADKRRPGTALKSRGRKTAERPEEVRSEQMIPPPADEVILMTRESKAKQNIVTDSDTSENEEMGDEPREGRRSRRTEQPRRVRRKTPHPRYRKRSSSSSDDEDDEPNEPVVRSRNRHPRKRT